MRAACRTITSVLVSAALAAAGCGGKDEDANDPRPPTPINVTAAITDARISLSPSRLGAGPITLIISNKSEAAQVVTLETDEVQGPGAGVRQTTSAINPRGTATLQVDLPQGTHEVRTRDRGIQPAALRVGASRRSAQDALRQP